MAVIAVIAGSPSPEELQDLRLESPGFVEFLLGLTTITATRLGGQVPMLCAITVERDGSPATVASSSEDARRLDEKQYVLDDGTVTISRILRLALRVHPPEPYPEHLRAAMKSRAVIDAAVSLIMVQNRCGREAAMELLNRAALATDTRLHAVAAEILRGLALPPPGPQP